MVAMLQEFSYHTTIQYYILHFLPLNTHTRDEKIIIVKSTTFKQVQQPLFVFCV